MHRDIDRNTEIRHVPIGLLYAVANILEINDDWKKVMSLIPKNPISEHFEAKYNEEHTRLIANYAKETRKKCAEVLFDEWGTSGRVRPTLGVLKDIILKAGIFRAADEIAIILKESLPSRPNYGPAAPITANISILLNGEATTYALEQNISTQRIESNNKQYTYTDKNDPGNNPTLQMKSASDLIEFSKDTMTSDIPIHLQEITKSTERIQNIEEPISMNVPNISELLKNPIDTKSNSVAYSETSEISFEIPDNKSVHLPEDYQMSFPNIDLNSGIDNAILQNTNVIYFPYNELKLITNNFATELIHDANGPIGRIGKGGFGEVYVGHHRKYGQLAIKKAKLHQQEVPPTTLFNTEVKFLLQFRHNNIVPILGVSIDGPDLCIVCDFIDGGSLDRKLQEKCLNEKERINIMSGVAEGLRYLHNSDKPVLSKDLLDNSDSEIKRNKFIHGDIKSANILLTKDCVAKLCDFGLAKQNQHTTFITQHPTGTLGYFAPEAQEGTITQKMDIYSFGIVLLELLTGLNAIVENYSETLNIREYIKENCIEDDITTVLDPAVSQWTKSNEIYQLAKNCVQRDRKKRPSIGEVCDILNSW